MALTTTYSPTEPTREEVDGFTSPAMLEFGSPICGYCYAAQPAIASAFAGHAAVRHIKIADGRGRRLGRSFGVKLWPTLVFLNKGREVGRLVRPEGPGPIREALRRIEASAVG